MAPSAMTASTTPTTALTMMIGVRVRRCHVRGGRSGPGASQYCGVCCAGYMIQVCLIGASGQPRGGKYLMSASWTTVVASSPSRVKNRPDASPREPAATGDSLAYSNQSSNRNSRWNHIE